MEQLSTRHRGIGRTGNERRDDAPISGCASVRKTYGDVVAVDDIDLEIANGEFFTMLGPSGSGKTTTLRMIAGFELPDSGTVELAGEDVGRLAPYEREVNTVFQDYALFPHMTVGENVEYGLRVQRVDKGERGDPPRRGAGDGPARRATRTASRPSSPGASASGWRWRARSSTARGCCCSTSRSGRST